MGTSRPQRAELTSRGRQEHFHPDLGGELAGTIQGCSVGGCQCSHSPMGSGLVLLPLDRRRQVGARCSWSLHPPCSQQEEKAASNKFNKSRAVSFPAPSAALPMPAQHSSTSFPPRHHCVCREKRSSFASQPREGCSSFLPISQP